MFEIVNGSRWREVRTGKIMTVVDAEYTIGPRYRYDGEDVSTWWYCDVADFFLSGRWEQYVAP